jgi:hypothetical protein
MTIERLPLLEEMLRQVRDRLQSSIDWGQILIVGNQHLLPSTCALVGSLLRLGVQPANLVLTGKVYSCRPAVVDWLRVAGVRVMPPAASPMLPGRLTDQHRRDLERVWDQVGDLVSARQPARVILLDDGGFGVLSMPADLAASADVVAIEQTSSGLRAAPSRSDLRRINLAGSAAKRCLESPFIAEAVARGVMEAMCDMHRSPAGPVGIVGMGNVGRALARHLVAKRMETVFFDRNGGDMRVPRLVRRAESLRDVCERCAIVVGCTGEDIFSGADWVGDLDRELTLFSASSLDVEFRSLLLGASDAPVNPGDDVERTIGTTRTTMPYSGFPINFRCPGERESPADIQLTRGLMLGAVLQAVLCGGLDRRTGHWGETEKLDEAVQRFTVRAWHAAGGPRGGDVAGFASTQWIREHSAGSAPECSAIAHVFSV